MKSSRTLKNMLRRLGRAIPVTESATDATQVFEHVGSITKLVTGSQLSKRAQRRAGRRECYLKRQR